MSFARDGILLAREQTTNRDSWKLAHQRPGDSLCPKNTQLSRKHLLCVLLHAPISFLLAALLLYLVPAAMSQVPNPQPTPPGRLGDVGGYRVHLYSVGTGSPTVMVVGAAFSFDWALVQPEVGKFTRICTFDPSGTAWSEPFREPAAIAQGVSSTSRLTPNCEDRVDEIRRLIMKAPITPPYILVGYSVGALSERLYPAQYRENIVGMIIVDHAFVANSGSNTASHSRHAPGYPQGYTPPEIVSQNPIVRGFEDDENFGHLPEEDQKLHAWALSQHPARPGYEMAEANIF